MLVCKLHRVASSRTYIRGPGCPCCPHSYRGLGCPCHLRSCRGLGYPCHLRSCRGLGYPCHLRSYRGPGYPCHLRSCRGLGCPCHLRSCRDLGCPSYRHGLGCRSRTLRDLRVQSVLMIPKQEGVTITYRKAWAFQSVHPGLPSRNPRVRQHHLRTIHRRRE
ncbi:hypothetical protein P171DRAFT_242654 [Karstenula rhodostoma CBS 690.94]|uniref:Uncharacterized protein n=1 Tax=Karstenula rhodostoma CBS 690.94 TaxID=1392251 RepID=A0A9P4UCQ4_9PLEO|nr:hypothetical protein P171DRAFT_242654 [Karstenula rhodostoma CBS 690.94]